MTLPGRVSSLIAVLLGVLIAGCGSSTSSTTSTSKSSSAPQGSNANAADRAFLAAIIPNDELAVAMAKVAQTHAQRPQLKVFSGRLIAGDDAQIAQLTALAHTLHVTPEPMKPTMMTGMENDAGALGIQMYQMGMDQVNPSTLATAKPFDHAFLTMMASDLAGAETMARQELSKGTNPQLRPIATTTVTDSGTGVSQLKRWQSMWYGKGMKGMSGTKTMKGMKGMKGMSGMSGMKGMKGMHTGTGTNTTGMSGMGTTTSG